MDSGEPGIGASDLKTGGIDYNATTPFGPRQDQVPAPTAQGGEIGDRERHSRKFEYRTQETDGLQKRQAINLLQEQRQQDDLIRVYYGTSPVRRGALIRDRRRGEIIPQVDAQTAAVAKFMILFFRVHFLFEKSRGRRVHLNAFI
jgi:hypothetical protein